ncbi:hypothetical protein HXA31_02170 [Salipaludibacillus agaradhaerens]|uniref:GTP-binding protein n=1 Tax=Salipaludibacillus agaradhaerens TaxID=76935 RepID=A0A9Q4B2X4_SALAG|nr:hypothetical protein [Salipaludibacillus agaradhaerens]MCR6097344.1 hypothetical protein [Salipaludibacillus agaradhaerens]MCR6113171.1 hypothetical protein [Salipaludibacillus agaradhaerens]
MVEEHMIHKTFFKTIVDEENQQSPVKSLGQQFYDIQMDETADLSSVRFAQGEVYYHHKDMESAVYKWELVKNELQPWARKNIGDAYYEMGWLREAESTYTSIQSESPVLSVEISLQLLQVYADKNNKDKVHQYIKKALAIDPNYPNVTDIARSFYEDEQDWYKAVELAVRESVRTASPKWFSILTDYAERGYTTSFAPEYFENVLLTVAQTEQRALSKLASALWESYYPTPANIAWVKTLNAVTTKLTFSKDVHWHSLNRLYYKNYLEFMSGSYLLNELKPLLPEMLNGWIKLTKGSDSVYPAAAILAWDESVSGTLSQETAATAESTFSDNATQTISMENMTALLETILQWADDNDVVVEPKIKWLVSQLWASQGRNILITGGSQSHNTTMLNHLLGEELFKGETATVYVKHGEKPALNAVNMDGLTQVEDMNELTANDLIELTWPSSLFTEEDTSIIVAKYSADPTASAGPDFDFVATADDVFYLIDATVERMEKEYERLLAFAEKHRDDVIHFVISSTPDRHLNDVTSRINELFTNAHILPVFSTKDTRQLVDAIKETGKNGEVSSNTTTYLSVLQSLLSHLLDRRETKENTYKQTIKFNEKLIEQIEAYQRGVTERETEKYEELAEAYHDIKEEMKSKVWEDVPVFLKETANEIDEEADFKNLHNELNDKMNHKIQTYLTEQLIPDMQTAFNDWLVDAKDSMNDLQAYLDHASTTLNNMYGEKNVSLQTDFQVVTDWKRDLNRMVNRVDLQEINIMNRLKPTQFLLKSAGKLLGNFQQNNHMLYNQYQKYIENDNFEDAATSIIKHVFFEFDLFEKNLKADISLCVEAASSDLEEHKVDAGAQVKKAQDNLTLMKDHPASFYDPLKIFEIRLHQYQLMSEKNVQFNQ